MALGLLVLLLHAAQAGATHLHQLSRGRETPAAARDEGAQAATDGGAHAQCLLCRLQRDLPPGLRNAGPSPLDPPDAARRLAVSALDARHTIPHGCAHGRAPPNA